MKILAKIFLLLIISGAVCRGQEQQFAQLGDFKLVSGATIKDCRIGYRTFGKLNADKSNVVVFATWAGGTTEQLKSSIVAGGMVDPAKYYVVAIDALANGVSSSPSNSQAQPRMKFPEISLADAVNTQHELLTKILKIKHVRAVMGVSMGGMQTFQWIVSYPDFMDKAIPVVGSPQLAAYDLVHWQMQLDALMPDKDWMGGDYAKNPARDLDYEFGAVLLTSPENFNNKWTRAQALENINKAKTANGGGFDTNDKIRQTQAMMRLDVTENFGGSWARAAHAVKAQVFVIVAREDHTVTPQPALNFAKLLNAPTLVLESDCGHLAPGCEASKVNSAIAGFLAQ